MKKVLSVLVPTCLSLSTFAFAATQTIGNFEEMKTACRKPTKYHNQIAPTNIQVSCKDVQVKWIPHSSTSKELATQRDITIQVQSDKYRTNEEMANIPTIPQNEECPAFKQIRESVSTVRSLTCDQLLAYEGTATSFCMEAVDAERAQNPEGIITEETGQVFNMCSVETPAQEQAQQVPAQEQQSKSKEVRSHRLIKKEKLPQ